MPGWYDFFAPYYDRAVEALYAPYRTMAREALALEAGARVLDAGCGTGQSFHALVKAVGPDGVVVGTDTSRGMLSCAAQRIEQNGWRNVHLLRTPLRKLEHRLVEPYLYGAAGFDAALFFLVLTAMPDWDAAFARVSRLVRPGGKLVIVDAYRERLNLQARMVNLVARADIRRPVWRALDQRCTDISVRRLSVDRRIGGDLIVAQGTKP